eukprot:jgi/Ulvmu1/207/UM001_0211.1
MGTQACTRLSSQTRQPTVWSHIRPAGLWRSPRGALPGLMTASVRNKCTDACHPLHADARTRGNQDAGARSQVLRTLTVFPALSSFLHGHLNVVHAVITVYPWPFYFLMAFAPRAALTERLLSGAKSLIPLAVLYGVLLAASWTPDTLSTLLPGDLVEGTKAALAGRPKMQFLPNIEAVGKLLSAPIASVSAWAHLQFIALFCARWIWLDGLVRGVNTVHSVLLCAVLPPLGFLAHIITTFLKRQLARGSGGDAASAPSASTPSGPQAANNAAMPTASQDPWTTPSAGVGVAGSYSQASGSNSAGRESAAAGSSTSAAGMAQFSRPGGRSRHDVPDSNSSGGAAQATPESPPSAAAAPASVAAATTSGAGGNGAAEGNGAKLSKVSAPAANDMSWLTILEPVYVQRG